MRLIACLLLALPLIAEEPLRVATFQTDVTPPIGTPLCCDTGILPATTIVDPLSARGVILFGAGKPIVLVAVDWVGLAGQGWEEWRRAIAAAAGTDTERVTVNTLHQHDAAEYDPAAERLLAAAGLGGHLFHPTFARDAILHVAAAVRAAAAHPQAISHLGLGKAVVEQVASNRRILGEDGKIKHMRLSSCKIPEAIAAPEGTIDPYVRIVSFWQQSKPIAAISYYATHPQSFYGKGGVSADFVGMARAMREAETTGVAFIHFNGAGGNVAAGKYNDGSPRMRPILAERLAKGMKAAWDATVRSPIRASDVHWDVQPVVLPPAPALLDEAAIKQKMADTKATLRSRLSASHDLNWMNMYREGRKIPLFLLSLGTAHVLYMPGELFIEYQLAAQKMAPDGFVAMAAYGDYSPGYIGTSIGYTQGGYETGPVSRTAPEVEQVLMDGMRQLLQRRVGGIDKVDPNHAYEQTRVMIADSFQSGRIGGQNLHRFFGILVAACERPLK